MGWLAAQGAIMAIGLTSNLHPGLKAREIAPNRNNFNAS